MRFQQFKDVAQEALDSICESPLSLGLCAEERNAIAFQLMDSYQASLKAKRIQMDNSARNRMKAISQQHFISKIY